MRPGFYRNPLISEAEGGLTCGDPFAMRFDGKYYLYCSARGDGRVYCQTSTDLVHWTRGESCIPLDEIPTITSEHGHYGVGVAYAPEVTYYNGKFYMVTSFGGTGHRTLVADRPEGPFKRKTENWGQHIDGDIFIDNDGKWRFYSADGRGIKYFDMVSPINIDPDSLGLTGAIIDDGWNTWTEGSMIVYHDGKIDGKSIEKHPYAEFADFTIANGEKIPTIDEYLEQGKKYPETMLVYEMKPHSCDEVEDRFVEHTIAKLKEHELLDPERVMFISFSYHIC